jgi:hypothetical protein
MPTRVVGASRAVRDGCDGCDATKIPARRDCRQPNHSALIRSFLIESGRRKARARRVMQKFFWADGDMLRSPLTKTHRAFWPASCVAQHAKSFSARVQIILISSDFFQSLRVRTQVFAQNIPNAVDGRVKRDDEAQRRVDRARYTHFVKRNAVRVDSRPH